MGRANHDRCRLQRVQAGDRVHASEYQMQNAAAHVPNQRRRSVRTIHGESSAENGG
jgi:hypothetical protein